MCITLCIYIYIYTHGILFTTNIPISYTTHTRPCHTHRSLEPGLFNEKCPAIDYIGESVNTYCWHKLLICVNKSLSSLSVAEIEGSIRVVWLHLKHRNLPGLAVLCVIIVWIEWSLWGSPSTRMMRSCSPSPWKKLQECHAERSRWIL